METTKLPDLASMRGRTVLITGATGGIGFELAVMLAAARSKVILTGRDAAKGEVALARIHREDPDASIVFERLDLASLASIKEFGQRVRSSQVSIDVLINNAGVMTPPTRRTTSDGFELQFGTNHLGHHALAAQVLPLLVRADAPRIVSMSSSAANQGRMNFDDLQGEVVYRPIRAYAQSKLANLLFIRHLQHLSDEGSWGLLCAAAHPGYARTDLVRNGPGELRGALRVVNALLVAFASHDARGGALPALLAATGSSVAKLDYYGPTRMHEFKGPPGHARLPKAALDDETARRLWQVSTELTGSIYEV